MIAQAPEEFLYTLTRALDQIGDDRNRVRPSLDHSGAISAGDAANRDQRFICKCARCPDPFQTNYRIRNLLGRGGEDRPDGNIVHWANGRVEQLALAVGRDSDDYF